MKVWMLKIVMVIVIEVRKLVILMFLLFCVELLLFFVVLLGFEVEEVVDMVVVIMIDLWG